LEHPAASGQIGAIAVALEKCKECGHNISDQASSCPSCGRPKPPPQASWFVRFLKSAITLFLAIAGAIAIFFALARSGKATLPECSSPSAISQVQEAFAEGPAGKVLGLKIIDTKEYSELSRTEAEVRCTAMVRLNNAHQGKLVYRFFVDGNRVFVEAKLPTAF
jgi:hypothetical protein